MPDMTDAEIKERLFKAIKDSHFVMLGLVEGSNQHPQPMTAYQDDGESGDVLWFYSHDDTDLASAVNRGEAGGLAVFTDKKQQVFASLVGQLTLTKDRERIDKFWNPVAAAWYPDGKDDPRLSLLRFDPSDAQVWISSAGPVKFAWEVAKANATKTEPDIGDQADLKL